MSLVLSFAMRVSARPREVAGALDRSAVAFNWRGARDGVSWRSGWLGQKRGIMKHILLLAGAAALGFAAPAFAKPSNGHGNGHGNHAYGLNGPVGYGIGGCPPGLAKKHNGCLPPGQAKKLFAAGQRFRTGFGGLSPYGFDQIPYDLRRQYGFDPYDNYYYGNGYMYQVDPRTMIVQQVIQALLR
jgi:hypothetical protein